MQVQIFDVEIELLTEMLGTVPKNKDVYRDYIESKRPVESGKIEDETETVGQLEEKGWTGFHSDEKGLFVYDYFIKGFFKNAANVLKESFKITAFRSKLNDYLFISPRRVYLGLKEPAGVIERPLRGQTAQGPRIALARSDFVPAGTKISFRLEVIENKKFKTDHVKELMDYGRYLGLGQFRNGSYGRFEVKKFVQV